MFRVLDDGRGRKSDEEGGTKRKEGQRGRRDEEEGGTRRKEGRGGRRDGEEGGTGRVDGTRGRRDNESENMKKLLKKMKKLLKDASLASLGLVLTKASNRRTDPVLKIKTHLKRNRPKKGNRK